MIQISKREIEFMIETGILKCVKGRYKGLICGSAQKPARAKSRWVEEPVFERMLILQEKLKVKK